MGAEGRLLIPAHPGAENEATSTTTGPEISPRAREIYDQNIELMRLIKDRGDRHPEILGNTREEPPKRSRGSPTESGSDGSDQPPQGKRPFEDPTTVMHDDVPPLVLGGRPESAIDLTGDQPDRPAGPQTLVTALVPTIDTDGIQP